MPVAWAQTLACPSDTQGHGCYEAILRAVLVQEVNRQAGVRWGQVSFDLSMVNTDQPGQTYI